MRQRRPLTGLMLMSCGGGQSTDSATLASATASPTTSASPLDTFRANDCVGQPTGSLTAPLGDNFHVVVRVLVGWTHEPPGATETELLVLDAPSGYSNQPTRIQVLSLLGYSRPKGWNSLLGRTTAPPVT